MWLDARGWSILGGNVNFLFRSWGAGFCAGLTITFVDVAAYLDANLDIQKMGEDTMKLTSMTVFTAAAIIAGAISASAQDQPMGFFVTSVGVGNGADLGGLDGADAHCTSLAEAAGTEGRTWKAYLSTQADGKRGVSARYRIGTGPWYNANKELIAADLDTLHISPNIVKRTAVDENGNRVSGVGDKPNQHDILTGSLADGMAYFPWAEGDHTCSNWTSSGEGSAQVGHHDRHGGGNISWNSTHGSRGCSQENLASTGGAGLFYCFAAD
jgi:hypothetical protein